MCGIYISAAYVWDLHQSRLCIENALAPLVYRKCIRATCVWEIHQSRLCIGFTLAPLVYRIYIRALLVDRKYNSAALPCTRGAQCAQHAGGRHADMRARDGERRHLGEQARACARAHARRRDEHARARDGGHRARTPRRARGSINLKKPTHRCWSRTRGIWGPPRSSARR